jgi:diguanylate cyclase (GGDEF)-like protein
LDIKQNNPNNASAMPSSATNPRTSLNPPSATQAEHPLSPAKILLIAALYIVAARVGQYFAIDPGNVTPVWIPSGLMIALALKYGKAIWPGVFIGAFSGNIWAYFSLTPIETGLYAIAAASLNGIGDVICCVVMAQIIITKTNTHYPFTQTRHFLWFLALAVIAGPLASAAFGIAGLVIFGFLAQDQAINAFTTWFIGDATGAMIFGPLLSAWLTKENKNLNPYYFLCLMGFCTLITTLLFGLIDFGFWLNALALLLLPAALFIVLYSGHKTAFSLLALVASLAVYTTSIGLGPFRNGGINVALMELQGFITFFSLSIYVIAIFIYDKQKTSSDLAIQKAALEQLYRQDPLTQTWNRYRIKEFIDTELSRFERSLRPFGLILFDIDDFKRINDQHGHLQGDRVLITLCRLVKEHTREVDLFGRWGGEEFIVVVTETSSLGALTEKIRLLVASHDFELPEPVTISLGVTTAQKDDTPLLILDRADEALYQSKQHGKNQASHI